MQLTTMWITKRDSQLIHFYWIGDDVKFWENRLSNRIHLDVRFQNELLIPDIEMRQEHHIKSMMIWLEMTFDNYDINDVIKYDTISLQ